MTMQAADEPSPSTSRRRRGHLPPLAPRNSSASSRGERSSSASGRPPRLSHRSRAGCWTCRGRKVKCDEIHPRCGPCTRLNRECDWDHRWNFSDATPNTQSRYTNVTTQGNAVWDPQVRSTPNSPVPRHDDMPAFATLQTDDERERKAETQRPGTFGVVVTPESFSDLPEYAATASPVGRRMSGQSQGSLFGRASSSLTRSTTQADPTTVVLDRFEDVSPGGTGSPFALPPPDRRPSLPDSMYYLAISTSPPVPSQTWATASAPQGSPVGNTLVARFRHYIIQRLCQPLMPGTSPDVMMPGSTKDAFEIEAQRFPPLHHAICAVSSLNLAYGRESTLEVAIEHYHSALSAATAQDALSDGGFLRHFLLLVYDICMPTSDDSSMWAEHLNHLKRIALSRQQHLGREPRGFIVWTVCELDTHAGLMGNGACDFVRHVLQHNLLPPLDQQIPAVNPAAPYAPAEAPVFPAVLALRRTVLIHTAKLAQLAQTLRREAAAAAAAGTASPGAYARWHDLVAHAQTELSTAWVHAYPDFLPPESPDAGRNLPYRVRYVFEQAYLLHQAATLYSRTSMFPAQRRTAPRPPPPQTDTERRALAILAVAAHTLDSPSAARDFPGARHLVLPLLLAGSATLQADAKVRALELVAALEGGGIGRNTARVRALLKAVYEAQRAAFDAGGNVGDVEWMAVARERGLTVVNCGL